MSKSAKLFGKKLKYFRLSRGLSQEGLAEKADLSVNAISSFERGERFPRARTVDALAEALGTSPDSLLTELLCQTSERCQESYFAIHTDQNALRELTILLNGKPDNMVQLIYDISRRILGELAHKP